MVVQLRLRRQEIVQEVLPPTRSHVHAGPPNQACQLLGGAPSGFGSAQTYQSALSFRAILPALLKPRMVGRCVRPHLVDDDFQLALVRSLQQRPEIIERPEHRIDIAIVRDVVSEIPHRALEEGRQPHAVHAQRLYMIKLRRNALEVADPVPIQVEERARIDLVHHRAAPPAPFRSRHT